jgi:hypothetical protein
MKENRSVVSYWNTIQELGRDMYIEKCHLNDRIGLAWFKFGTWKLRGKSRGVHTAFVTKKKIWFMYYYNVMRHRGGQNSF